MVSSDVWDAATAARHDEASAAMFAPEVVGPAVDPLAGLAGDGAALEFAVGTGRLALPLAARGVPVKGIDLSAPMLERLRAKDAAQRVPVVLGDMATTRVPGEYAVVYLAFNTIGNLCTQRNRSPASATRRGTCGPAGGSSSRSVSPPANAAARCVRGALPRR